MSLEYSTDLGYGIRVRKHEAEPDGRPPGHIVEIHFYRKEKAVEYVSSLIRAVQSSREFYHALNPNIRGAEERWQRRNMITKAQLENWFTYHSPTPEQLPKYQAIREAAMKFAIVILDNTPPCADQTAAIRKIREAAMTANQSIACNGE